MFVDIKENLSWIEDKVRRCSPVKKMGKVLDVKGLIIESQGPDVGVGDLVEIVSRRNNQKVQAEVVGFRGNHVLLMALETIKDIHPGCYVIGTGYEKQYPIGEGLKGRIIDGLGKPIDDLGKLKADYVDDLHHESTNPMMRQPINSFFETGIKSIDLFTSLGRGQRLGIFSGSGVGKSTLLGMLAKSSESDVNVIALVGERGRELRDFIDTDLGEAGLRKSVIIVSTSDQPAPLRIRATLLAVRIAEYFRDEGKNVLFLMDSLTRFAMAQREIGLAIGEPPASRGYTPSVFSLLPKILERSGYNEKGSITGLYTVLVEGDDFNEPISDAVRGLVDGHIVLSRKLASSNHFPAIDVLESISRLFNKVTSEEHYNLIGQARDMLSLYRKNEDLINIGAYVQGTNSKIDKCIKVYELIMDFLKQSRKEYVSLEASLNRLKEILK